MTSKLLAPIFILVNLFALSANAATPATCKVSFDGRGSASPELREFISAQLVKAKCTETTPELANYRVAYSQVQFCNDPSGVPAALLWIGENVIRQDGFYFELKYRDGTILREIENTDEVIALTDAGEQRVNLRREKRAFLKVLHYIIATDVVTAEDIASGR